MSEIGHWIAAPLHFGFMQHAFAEVLLIGMMGGVLGCWVVLFGASYSAESLAHGMFPGLVVATLVGAPLLLGGAVGVLVAAGAVAAAGTVRGIDRDTSVAVVITGIFGGGVLLGLSPSSPPGLGELLFGDVLAVSARDVGITAMVVVALVAALLALHGRLLVVGFDRGGARAVGVRPALVEALLLALVAVAVVVGVQVLGSLLVLAVLVAPAAAARLVFHRLPEMMAGAAVAAVAAGVVGLYLSYYADLAAGAAIALCLVGGYLAALVADGVRRRVRSGRDTPGTFP
jgi:ABC-type Mn2+/Zn2+ transport system permease subunit